MLLDPPVHNGSKKNFREWIPNSVKQAAILSRRERELLFGGARGGGKTEAGLVWLIRPEYVHHPAYRSLVIRKDYDDLQDWIFRAKMMYSGLGTIGGTPPVITWAAGGMTRLGHWKDQNTVSKYIGHEYWLMLIEELTQAIASEKEYLLLLGSLRINKEHAAQSGASPQLLGTTNPGGKGHAWVKRYWVDVAREKVFIDPKTKYTRLYIPSLPSDNPDLSDDYRRWLGGLPEKVRMMWEDGNWSVSEGMYFSNFDAAAMEEKPFFIEAAQGAGRLFGGFDYGWGLNGIASGGIVWVDPNGVPHLLCTWTGRNMDAETQADAFFEFIDSFHWTDRVFPEEIFYDYAMDSPVGMNKNPDAAPIDYFKKRFQSRKTRWVPANKSRVNGWQIVADYFGKDVRTCLPKLKYWPDYNGEWDQTIPLLQHDPNNPMDVLKCDIDHWADWTRYLLVGIRRRSAVERSGQSTVSYNDVYAQINKMRRCETGMR